MGSSTTTDTAQALPVSTEAQLARYDGMILAVPEAPEDDGTGMILAVLNATSWDQVNLEGKLPSFKELDGRMFQIDSVARRQGDEQYGKGWYIVADCVDTDTGESFKAQTSAGVAMAQLVALHNLGAFPAHVRVESAQTKNGQTAVNIKVLAGRGPRK